MTGQMLEVGRSYRAIGPDPEKGGKWEAPVVEVVGIVDGIGYQVKAPRQVANVILFGCEHFWRPVDA